MTKTKAPFWKRVKPLRLLAVILIPIMVIGIIAVVFLETQKIINRVSDDNSTITAINNSRKLLDEVGALRQCVSAISNDCGYLTSIGFLPQETAELAANMQSNFSNKNYSEVYRAYVLISQQVMIASESEFIPHTQEDFNSVYGDLEDELKEMSSSIVTYNELATSLNEYAQEGAQYPLFY